MKKFTFLLAVVTAFTMYSQGNTANDTVAAISDVKNVVITEVNGGVKVEVSGTDKSKNYVYSYKHEAKPEGKVSVTQDWGLRLPFSKSDTSRVYKRKRHKWAVVSGGFYIGFNNAVDDVPELGVKAGSSVEIAWDRILGLQYHPFAKGPRLAVGFGVGWKNFKIKDSYNCFVGDKNGIELEQFGNEMIPKYSRLKVFSLRVPFTVRQNLGEGFSLTAGAVMNLNTHASVKNCYLEKDGTKVERSFSGVPVRKVTWDVMGSLNYECLGLYVKYSPKTYFEIGKGPQFKSLAIGFGIFL